MAWPTRKNLLKSAYSQLKGNFLGFLVGTSAASFVSTFFETRKVSNLWGLTARKTVVSGSTFRFLEWFCALVVGFIVFEVVNNLVKEKLRPRLEKISPRASKTIRQIAHFNETFGAPGENDTEPAADAAKRNGA